ncbi:MAG: DUF692 domain-containing protein [Gammaproteobacteria bacterium]|nr:DUF692 domain-containing protein [Gammaproteobacteria bacterium]
MLGFGLGLRTDHYSTILDTHPPIDWFEILSENYMIPGGKPLYFLDQIREHYPMVMHGVSLSIGSTDPLNWDYLNQLKDLATRLKPAWISDHLCWTGINKQNIHDLLPLPYTTETIQHVVQRVKAVQDFLGQQILLENVSSYITFKNSELSEWDFLATIAIEADCKILLDINNIYVSSFNHGFDPHQYLEGIPCDRVQQFHLAGHTNNVDHIIDTHDAPIVDPVWQLYAAAVKRFGRVATMIERDDNIPPLTELLTELDQAKAIMDQVLSSTAPVAKQTKKDSLAENF